MKFMKFIESLTIYSLYFELQSKASKSSIFTFHGLQMLRTQLKISLPKPSKGYKDNFP